MGWSSKIEHPLESYINDVTASGKGAWGFCANISQALVLKSVGEGVKKYYNLCDVIYGWRKILSLRRVHA